MNLNEKQRDQEIINDYLHQEKVIEAYKKRENRIQYFRLLCALFAAIVYGGQFRSWKVGLVAMIVPFLVTELPYIRYLSYAIYGISNTAMILIILKVRPSPVFEILSYLLVTVITILIFHIIFPSNRKREKEHDPSNPQ